MLFSNLSGIFRENFYRQVLSCERAAAATNCIGTYTDCSRAMRSACVRVDVFREKICETDVGMQSAICMYTRRCTSREKTREIDVRMRQRDRRE